MTLVFLPLELHEEVVLVVDELLLQLREQGLSEVKYILEPFFTGLLEELVDVADDLVLVLEVSAALRLLLVNHFLLFLLLFALGHLWVFRVPELVGELFH